VENDGDIYSFGGGGHFEFDMWVAYQDTSSIISDIIFVLFYKYNFQHKNVKKIIQSDKFKTDLNQW
jgi:hypothetical protein